MASKVSRAALFAGIAIGASGLVAVPAMAANNFVPLPAVTGVTNLTPSSVTLTGAVSTGGDPGTVFTAPASPGSNLSINTGDILGGIPLGQGFVSNVLFEVDPMSDFVAAGNQPGGQTVIAQNIEVPTRTGLTSVRTNVGAYPVATANATAPLKPGTRYVYFIVQQIGASDQATTVNEFSTTDLANWIAGSGKMTGAGFASPTTVTASNDFSAWLHGTGSFAGDPGNPTRIPATVVNPDYQCVLNSTIAANPSGAALTAAGAKVPAAPGPNTAVVDGTGATQNLQFGIASGGTGGALTPATAPQPASQGSCIFFFGGNSTNFYQSAIGRFRTPPLGSVAFANRATVRGRTASVMVRVRSQFRAAGQLRLTAMRGKKTVNVAQGRIVVPAQANQAANVRLTAAGQRMVRAAGRRGLATRVRFTSTTDQPSTGRTIRLTSGS